VITNIGVVHMEFFNTHEDLARAKGELVAGLSEQGVAVLNADDPFYPLLVAMTAANITSFGVTHGDYRVEGYRAAAGGGSQFSVRGVEVKLKLEGRHQATNAAAALAAGVASGVPLEAGAHALEHVMVEHRLEDHQVAGGYSIVDDAYNASPESMLAAFEALAESPRRGRLLAVLGQMAELGSVSEEAHRRVGRRAAEVFAAVCVVDGERARVLAESAGAELVADKRAAAEWVRRNAREGDRILIKASHGVGLDQVVNELTQP
jgi:UDP-N-acetylmuramoyl-tripeptide--D-alanyl-D-alanine ligase